MLHVGKVRLGLNKIYLIRLGYVSLGKINHFYNLSKRVTA